MSRMQTRRSAAASAAHSSEGDTSGIGNIDVVEPSGDDEYLPPPPTLGRQQTRQVCPYGCGRVVAQRTVEVHRNQGCRGLHEEPFGEADRKRNYLCGVCCMEFHTRRGFMDHMNDEHDVAARVHILDFASKETFERFFHWLEVQGGANFRTRSGAKRQLSGKRAMLFRCNRTGFVESAVPGGRKDREKLGPVRCGYSCTAYIQVTFHENGTCTATFCGDHYGHDARLRVPQGIKNLIGRYVFNQDMGFGDIVRLLHYKFAPLCNENVLAQRICMIDNDEIRTIVLGLKRQVENGCPLPNVEDVWDEELLDKAGIDRPWLVRRNLRPGDKVIDEIAREQDWPIPSMFVAKQKAPDGEYRPVVHMLMGRETVIPRGGGEGMEEEEVEGTQGMTASEMVAAAEAVKYADVVNQPGSSYLLGSADSGNVETVEFDAINVEDIEDHDELQHFMSLEVNRMNSGPGRNTQRKKGNRQVTAQRAFLVRQVLSEANYIRTLVASNINYQTDDELLNWTLRLRRVRREINDANVIKTPGAQLVGGPTAADAFYESSGHDELLPSERKRNFATAFNTTEPDTVSDDEDIISQCSAGVLNYRPDLWN